MFLPPFRGKERENLRPCPRKILPLEDRGGRKGRNPEDFEQVFQACNTLDVVQVPALPMPGTGFFPGHG